MDLFKNTIFVTVIWIILAFLLSLIGIYREHLYREQSKKQQIEAQQDLHKRMSKMQTLLEKIDNTVNNAVKSGKMDKDTAKEIKNIYHETLTDRIVLNDKVEVIKNPPDNNSGTGPVTLKDEVEVIKNPSNKDSKHNQKARLKP